MYSDFITFLKSLLTQNQGTESILPDSFGDKLPVDSVTQTVSQFNDTAKIAGAVICLILALMACFLGYKLCRMFMTITGFMGGIVLGYLIGSQLLKLNGPLTGLVTLLGGILVAIFAYRVYAIGIFILCFILAFIAAAAFLPFTGDIQFFLATLIGFIIGSLAVRFIRPVIIMSSAIVGGAMAAGLITELCQLTNIYTFSKFSSGGLTLVVCLLGIFIQFLTTSDEDEEKRKKKKAERKILKKAKKLEKKRLKKEEAA